MPELAGKFCGGQEGSFYDGATVFGQALSKHWDMLLYLNPTIALGKAIN